ncbi:hypothetical protein MPSEU_000586800 [Mayamaea pseudoterrestris]|nr:hypothetical protein MPSEU_000586800 [Mayamaea pseudoterrestris]
MEASSSRSAKPTTTMTTTDADQPSSSSHEDKSQTFDPFDDDYITTTTKAYVSKNATIHGASQLELKGKTIIERNVTIHADLARVTLGQHCYIHHDTLIQPPNHVATKKPIAVSIGAYTSIGSHCEIHAASIGSHCLIGNHVSIGERVIIKDCCYVGDHTVLANDVVVPPLTRLLPCVEPPEQQWNFPYCAELPVAVQTEMQRNAGERFQEFVENVKK